MLSDEDKVMEFDIFEQAVNGRATTKMAALIGYIDVFEESTEQWSMYIERFEQFAETNDFPLAKKVSVFLSVMGLQHTNCCIVCLLQINQEVNHLLVFI